MKPPTRHDEIELWDTFVYLGGQSMYEAAAAVGVSQRRMEYLVNKWTDLDLVNYGVSAGTCWREGEGVPPVVAERDKALGLVRA